MEPINKKLQRDAAAHRKIRKITQEAIADSSDYLRGHSEVAAYAKISPRCASDWQARGIIPYIKIGRKCVLFRKRDIDAALSKFEVHAIG